MKRLRSKFVTAFFLDRTNRFDLLVICTL